MQFTACFWHLYVYRIDGFLAGFLAVLSITRGNFSPQSQKLSFSVTRVDGDCFLLYYASIDLGFGGGRARVTHGCWIWRREEREPCVVRKNRESVRKNVREIACAVIESVCVAIVDLL